jgi:signal peptidase II
MALIVLVLFWVGFRDAAAHSRTISIAFGAIAGGAIGNVIDRFHYGYVVDFIDFRWWPVFNAADSCITLGVFALIVTTFLSDRAARAVA